MDLDNLPDLEKIILPTDRFDAIKQAAESGNIMAMKELSKFYKTGFGTDVDLEKSEYWYKKAIN